ncbi:hypothetical protein OIU77_002423 [Salix suchowensis]|uniref:Alkaline ceramidase n=1 Tax=Salix suchowensis TaxID=1278906 RepID=A0ABQ9B4U9_9ROSI|nr:hypothetical protein OIU77_002423 [Salix suchowensis]
MAEGISSFWGPVTSAEWCEKNYVYSSYIAEFFNTISIIPGILLALVGLINALRQRFEKRFSILHISNMILAIGSMLYHATLQHMQQQGDETPMVWEMLLYMYILYSPDWHYRSTMPTFLFFYGAGFAIVHALVRLKNGFQGTLCAALPSLRPPDVQVLHSHKRCISKAACKIIFGYHSHGKSLLAF